jgi:tetratricopeptide (TPR) repeat protein
MASAFISHSSPDDRYVTELEQFVRGLGYDDVFNDGHSIAADEKFWQCIEQNILACDAFVVVLSHASVDSYWVDREVQFARAAGKRVVPIRIDDCRLPPSFEGRDVIDLRQGRGDRVKIAPSRILRHSPDRLFGREEELEELDAAWESRDSVHVYTLVAVGGAGKTSLVAHWVAKRFVNRGWPGVERYFDWSFYSQGTRETSQASGDFFIAAALEFFGDPDPQKGSPWQRGQRLAERVRRHRTLLVLDGIEPLQYPPNSPQAGELKDEALAALLQGLAMDNPGLCLVTSREPLKNLETFCAGGSARQKRLDRLTKQAAVALLRHLQIVGSDDELEAAWRDAGGHALTLGLLGRFLADAHGGDIRRRREVDFQTADRETPGRTAMKVMLAYETWLSGAGPDRQRDLAVLRLMGLFDRPATADCLAALRAEPAIEGLTDRIVDLEDWQWNKALKDLESLELISQSGVSFQLADSGEGKLEAYPTVDAHPLVREYFSAQLRERLPEAFRAAHGRLFDHLCEMTKPHRPDTLAGLQPLYQAVAHGCLAGRQQEALYKVYVDRILRGTGDDGFYSTKKLGAIGADLGAVAAFFDSPWRRLSPNLSEAAQAWLLSEAALRLRALGRLTEAREPMRVSLERLDAAENWQQAAIAASNLSELEATLGLLGEAVDDGRRAIEWADRSGDANWPYAARTTAADALHQRGERGEARALFEEAERMQADDQPQFPLLYSLQGFRYADLILAPAERAAWRRILVALFSENQPPGASPRFSVGAGASSSPQEPDASAFRLIAVDAALAACAEAAGRASQTLEWMNSDPNASLLEIALDHLTLARAGLYRAILESVVPAAFALLGPASELDLALNGLRQAGALNHVPKALLTASLLERMKDEGGRRKSEQHLAEAQLIAERGPMPLYLADVHLHRARLFADRTELAKARALIEKHHYGRRREELADAEAATGGTGGTGGTP